MKDYALLSILHISDFHYSKRQLREQEIVVDALINDLVNLCIGHRRPDLILFTGDLVQAGGTDSHEEAYDALLDRVAAATGCSDERVIIVPGNHDLSQSIVDKTRAEHLQWRDTANNMQSLNQLYADSAFSSIGRTKFAAHGDLEHFLGNGNVTYRNDFASVCHFSELNIDVVILNTSMLSVGGHRGLGDDQGKLAVPEYAVLEAAKHLTPNTYRIFTTHHPFGMLSEAGARYLRGAVEQYANLHLFGHMHDPDARNTTSFKGELFSDQAGAVFTQRKGAYIGYSLISVDRAKHFYETHLRTYFDDRKAFDEARDIIDQGKFYSSQEAREFWRKVATPVEERAFRAHLAGRCLASLKAEGDSGPGERDPHEMFVPPPMKRTSIRPIIGDEYSTEETLVGFDDLVSEDGHIIIFAAPEYGRTSVLKEIQYRLLQHAESVRFPRLPIIIDFNDIKHNVTALLRVVKSSAIDPPDSADIESLLQLGHACLLVDDVLFADARRMEILREFVRTFPKARYIFSSPKNSAAPFGARVVPEMPIHFEFVELCVLRRREMRQLVLKFGGRGDVDILLDRLQSEFQEINLPFTAANGSILMSIYEEQSGFRPINRSVLIEQFIDTTLRKASIEESRRETFDYANKTALLAHIAAWMAFRDDYSPKTEAVRTEIKAYLNKVGLNAPVDQLMAEFLVARIFVQRSEERLSFRYRAVLEYFIAIQMRDQPHFKFWVMDESRYLQFVNEIHYHAGKLRNDAELVDEIGLRFAKILQQIEEKHGSIDLDQLTSLKLPVAEDANLDRLSQQLSAPPMSQEERDEELEADLPRDVEERQEVFRPRIENPAQKLLVALFLYSGVLKNMELIKDAEKRRHLTEIWKGWSIFLHLSLEIVPQLAQHRRLRINGVMYEIRAPHGMSDGELARAIALKLPIGVSNVLSATLGTEKLERQLTEPQLETVKEPLIYELLRASLIADLRLNATTAALRAALVGLRHSSYLLEAMIWKISDLRRLDRLVAFKDIEAALAEGIATLKGGTREARADEKRRQLKRLRTEGLLLRIKRQNEPD